MNLKMPVLQQHIPKGWFSKHSTDDLENWIYYYIIFVIEPLRLQVL